MNEISLVLISTLVGLAIASIFWLPLRLFLERNEAKKNTKSIQAGYEYLDMIGAPREWYPGYVVKIKLSLVKPSPSSY